MAAYPKRMPAGFPGDYRADMAVIESGFLDPATGKAPSTFGVALKIAAGLFQKIEAGDVAESVYGFLLRTAPQIGVTPDENGNSTGPSTKYEQAILKSGFMNVICKIGTPVRGNPVYMRLVADTGKLVGDIEATADKVVVPGAITGTGTGTMAATVTAAAKAGTYLVTLSTTSQTSVVTVVDPDGFQLKNGVVGTEYSANGLTFTITAAGTMTAGDHFHPVVTDNNAVLPGVKWAVGGKDTDLVSEIHKLY